MHHSSYRRGTHPTALAVAVAVALALLAPLALPFAASAEDDATSAADTGVARMDGIAGDVAIQRGDSGDRLAAVRNAPVLGADYVTTGPGARAEVGFDGRAAVRLGEGVQVRFARIEAQNRELQLAAGTIDLRLFGDTDGQSTIDTPSISIVPRSAGSFRVSVDENGETAVTVRSGHADIVTPQGTQPLDPGTTLVAGGPAANPTMAYRAALAFDGFDGYNADRDRSYTIAQAQAPYVNTEIQGVGDLATAGRWVPDANYGNVWIPVNVAPDWAPYRDGNWVWEEGYGWTWVANESWGWAPYHYGRWYFSEAYHRWAWFPPAPGRIVPAWSPALVGFVGFSVGAVSVGIGNIGWVPLAPYEAYHPWWGRRAATNVVSVNASFGNTSIRYRNMNVAGAMTSVTRENFQNGRFDHPYVASPDQVRGFRPVALQGPLPVVPSRANLRFTQREPGSTTQNLRASFGAQPFAGRSTFAPRTPFTEQQANVSRMTRVPVAPAYVAPAYVAPPARPAANDPWSRFGSTRPITPAVAPAAAAPAYARPATPAEYPRPATPAYGTPSYQRTQQPAYQRTQQPAYQRTEQPVYQRTEQPAYQRPASPAYQPGAGPAYQRAAPPAFVRQTPAVFARPAAPRSARPQPEARASEGGDTRHDR